jgi:hypothetical protein
LKIVKEEDAQNCDKGLRFRVKGLGSRIVKEEDAKKEEPKPETLNPKPQPCERSKCLRRRRKTPRKRALNPKP